MKFDTTKTVQEALAGQVAVIGENLQIRRFAKVLKRTVSLLLTHIWWKDRRFSRR